MKHYDIWVEGKVQGVWFRKFTKLKADELGLNGWVRNLPDGRVQIAVEGGDMALSNFLLWCQEGSPLAEVNKVEHFSSSPQGYDQFTVRN